MSESWFQAQPRTQCVIYSWRAAAVRGGPNFRGRKEPQFLRYWGPNLSNVVRTQNSALHEFVSDIRYVALFWNYSASEDKFRSNFALLIPCKMYGEGVDEISD